MMKQRGNRIMSVAFWMVLALCLAAVAAPFVPRLQAASGTLSRCAVAVLLYSLSCGLFSELTAAHGRAYSAAGVTAITAGAAAAAAAGTVLLAKALGNWWNRPKL